MSFKSKEKFRNYCKKRIFKKKRYKKGAVERVIVKIIRLLRAKNVLLFMPMPHEPDISGLFKLRNKINIYVPFMEGKSFKMVKYRLPIKKRRFGIKEPPNSFLKSRIDLAIVPVIGVDGGFRRVGFGKGMYDRFFSNLSYRPKIVFIQKELCYTKSYICDDFDIQGDVLVTPKQIIIRGDKDVDRDIGRKLCGHFKRCRRVSTLKKDRKRQT